MAHRDQDFGRVNPEAPAELSRFAFLIGDWHCEAKLESANGTWQTYRAAWRGRFILDGYAIADEYEMFDRSGRRIVLGTNFRSYDSGKRIWNIRWLNGLAGNWTNLVSEEMGGLKIEGHSIIYAFKEPVAGHAYTRATYASDSSKHFTWQGEKSEDGQVWTKFMIVQAYRDEA